MDDIGYEGSFDPNEDLMREPNLEVVMKTYYAIDLSETDGPMRARVYAAYDADQRFEQLERALKSCSAVIKAELYERSKFKKTAEDALNEADKALALMERSSHD